eukprot:15431538-Alexandrium_andersonii.AAC.1
MIHSAATPEGSKWLDGPGEDDEPMTDPAARDSLRRRMALPALTKSNSTGSCQHRRNDGQPCGDPLDPEGHHGCSCAVGGGTGRRHDAIRDRIARRIALSTGAAVHKEQYIPSLDAVNRQGVVRRGRADLVVARAGKTYMIDLTIATPWSTNAASERAASRHPGWAAQKAEDEKRRRYPGGVITPLAIETGGRWGRSGLAVLRAIFHDDPVGFQQLLREVSVAVQSHTSAQIEAAIGGG